MDIVRATAKYETWLGRSLNLVKKALRQKHAEMAKGAFPLLRATFYRWAQLWPEVCDDLAGAPRVLAVGDLHLENFGTWRDAEGRLVWGVNDFDEACVIPYASDLVRLATSVNLTEKVRIEPEPAAQAILDGYRDSLKANGRPYVLAEAHGALREMARSRLRDPEAFWEKLEKMDPVNGKIPAAAEKALLRLMPDRKMKFRLVERTSGLGSLGRPRYVALGLWCGGLIAREAKAIAPSGAVWASGGKSNAPILCQKALDQAIRCPDPFVRIGRRWAARRLAPDCSRIELTSLPEERDETRLLHAMGFEAANVHLGSLKARVLAADLSRRPEGWLVTAARRMEDATRSDWQTWRNHYAATHPDRVS